MEAQIHMVKDGDDEWELYINGWYIQNIKKEMLSNEALEVIEELVKG